MASGNNHLCFSIEFTNKRRAVAANPVFAGRLPDGLSRPAIERHDVRLSIMVAINNHGVFKHDRVGAVPPHTGVPAGSCDPLAVALQVVGGNTHMTRMNRQPCVVSAQIPALFTNHLGRDDFPTGVQNGNVDVQPVARRRARCPAIEPMDRCQGRSNHDSAPDFSATPAIQTQKDPLLCLFITGNKKEGITQDHRRGMPNARNLDLIGDIIILAPLGRDVLLQTRPIAPGPPPPGPILGL